MANVYMSSRYFSGYPIEGYFQWAIFSGYKLTEEALKKKMEQDGTPSGLER